MSAALPAPADPPPALAPALAPAPDDAALLAAFLDGDDRAFESIYQRYRDPVTSYAWRMLQRREVAEEVATEVFCRIVRGACRPGGSLRSYLFTVTHRLCLDRLRRRSIADRAWRLIRVTPGPAPDSPEADALADEDRRRLERAIARLPESHRATVLLFYGQELPSKEVAEILGLEDHQVRSQLSYARRRLRALLTEGEEP
ncbi:MAG: sigma-70 family RNA polymerase sigma factor [Alphaproteobacteria bacterium]|nr:sigma-70 family RNA polymerase sigma factor [Alphaproteobacteria bacterium]